MPQFRYRAIRTDGTVVEVTADGESEHAVRSQIEHQGLLLLKLVQVGSLGFSGSPKHGGPGSSWQFKKRLSLREFLIFNTEFLALMKAGVPILKVFDVLAERARHSRFQAALQTVRNDIRGGASISTAMAQHSEHFSELYRGTLQSGEQTGSLIDVLQRYIAYLKLVIEVREKVVKALAYPSFLVVVGAAVVIFLLAYVMPTFSEIYGESQQALPLPTRLLLAAVDHLEQSVLWLLAGAAIAGGGLFRTVRTPRGQAWLHRFSLRLPLIGDVLLKNQIIRMARTLSTVLAGGMPLLTAMQITSNAVTNRMVAHAVTTAMEQVRQGTGLAAALNEQRFLPPMTVEMIEVGETTGSLETMLHDIAEFHEGELDLRLGQLTTWIEPALLLIMGFIVGGIVIVMYLPVFQMAGTV